MNFDIYTTGGIEFLSQVYKGVIMTFGDSSYETLLRLFGLFSLIFGSIALIGKQQIDYLAKRVAILFLISGFSFGLRADVTIIDTKHDQTYVVSGAPWIPAYVHSLFSAASYQLTNTAQQIFHTGTVNVYEAAATGKNAWASVNLDYNKTGFGGFFEYLNFFKNYRFNTTGITDLDRIYRKFHTVLTECTINEIPLWPDNDFQKKIMLSSNLIQDLRPTVNGYVEFEGQPTDCIALYDSAIDNWNAIKSKFDTAGDPTLNLLAKLGITAMDSQKVQEANAEILQQGTMQLSNMIGQAGMVWALSDAWDSFLADQSPERAMVYKYEMGRNIEESKQMGRSLGLYAKETVPLMKIVFESMTIAFIPVTFLIILISGGNVIRNSIFSFAWVYAWDPVLATINGIVNIAAIAKVKAALNAAAVYNNALNGEWMAYSIQALNIMYSTLDYIPSVAGYLAISTPGIAYMLIKGGEVTMAGIASMMAAPVMSAPTHAEAASSLETQKIAQQTGKSFGQVEMQYNAAGQAKLNAMVFQSGAQKHGYNTLEKSGMGSFEKGVAGGLGDKQVMDKYGINTVANANANLEAGRVGSGSHGDMDSHFNTGKIEQQWRQDYQASATLKTMAAMSENQYANAYATGQIKQLAGYENIVNKAKAAGLDVSTPEAEHRAIREMARIQEAGGLMDGKMANTILGKDTFKDTDKVVANWQADEKGTGYFIGSIQDGNKGIELRDGRLMEKGALRDADVPGGYKFSGSYTKETDLTEGKTISEYTGVINGKRGQLTVDADGKAVLMEAKGGEMQEQKKVNTEITDTTKTTKWGTREEGGHKRDVTNTNLTGNIEKDHDVKIKEIGRGPNYIGSLTYAIQSGDRSFVSPIGEAKAFEQKQAAIRAVANEVAGDTSKRIDITGGDVEKYLEQERGKFSMATPKTLSNVFGLGYDKVGGSDKFLSMETKGKAVGYMAEDRLWQTAARAQQQGYEWGSKQFNEMLAKDMKEFQTGLIQKGRAVSGESGEKAREISQR